MQTQRYVTEHSAALDRRGRSRERSGSWQGTATSHTRLERRAQRLGLFSIGLGLAEVFATRSLSRLIGARDNRRTRAALTALGLREITSGVAILLRPQKAPWLWSRVAGDLLDLTLLSQASGSRGSAPTRLSAASVAVLGVTLFDAISAVQLSRESSSRERYTGVNRQLRGSVERGVHVKESITVFRRVEEVYQFWRNFENLPKFMAHLESVRIEDGRSWWRAKAPAGTSVEWQAEVIIDRPNQLIAWRSMSGSQIPNEGRVEFLPAPGGRGTEIRVELKYHPPGGKLTATLAKLFGEEPGQQIKSDLRRFKQVLETGEIIHSDASIHRGMHPARPARKL